MTWIKRIGFFLIINLLVVLTISVLLNLFHVQPYLTQYGLNMKDLMLFCLIWGMAGAFISLGLSRIMAKMLIGVRVIDPRTSDSRLQSLLQTVERLVRKANLPDMPEVGIYESPEVNAFATGPTKRRSLVALSSGLLNRMNAEEVEGVLAHEISHIANGDMVTMTLLQGIVNAFVMFLARVLAFALSGLGKDRKQSSHGSYVTYMVLVFVFEMVFMVLGFMVIAGYARFREYRADRSGADLAGKQKMIGALQAIGRSVNVKDERAQNPAFQAFKISQGPKSKWTHLFSTHPSLEMRIARLKGLS